ncbi:PAS domain S-box protein [Thermodesulfobacteriota bacterium]
MRSDHSPPLKIKVFIGFGIIVFLFLILGAISIIEIRTLGSLTSTIYSHPLKVSNAALSAQISTVAMHRSMKDVVLADDPILLEQAINKVAEEEKQGLAQLDIVSDLILGSEGQSLEKKTRNMFLAWRFIREEVIQLVAQGENKKAALITQGKGADHEFLLEQQMLSLTSYAQNKADGFIRQSMNAQKRFSIITSLAVIIGAALSIGIAFFTARQIFSSFDLRKKAEKALEKRSIFLDKIIDSSEVSMWISDAEGTAIRANPACLELFGATEKEVIGKYNLFKDVVIEAKGFMPVIQGVFEKKEPAEIVIDYNFSAVDHVKVAKAKHKVIKSVFTPILDNEGEISNVIVQTIDLTDIKKSEEELRNQKKFMDNVIDSLSDTLYIFDADAGTGIRWNKMLEEISGYDYGKMRNYPPAYFYPEEEHERIGELMNEIQQHGSAKAELTFIISDGSTIPFEYSVVPVSGPEGQSWMCAIGRDISERKQAEKDKEKFESQLRQAAKMQAVGTLAGGVAHEFNNLLGVIMGSIEISLDKISPESLTYNSINRALKASFRARDLVKQILMFSRQQLDRKSKPLNLALCIRETLDLIQPTIPSSIELIQNLPEDYSSIMADPSDITQVMMNLCSNGVWAMKEKGILTVGLEQVDLGSEQDEIVLGLKAGQYLKLSVSDTGEGMDRDTIERVFEPFFSTKEVGQGTGMGMATVHGIMESYGGAVSVESELGKGTIFYLYFPRMLDMGPGNGKLLNSAESDSHHSPTGKETILFIDDEPMYTEMGKDTLESLGYVVIAKTDSREALEIFKGNPQEFDVVITDQIMPHLSGDDLVKELLALRPDIPIILCTGYSSQIDEEHATSLGVSEFILKPLQKKKIALLIRKVLGDS